MPRLAPPAALMLALFAASAWPAGTAWGAAAAAAAPGAAPAAAPAKRPEAVPPVVVRADAATDRDNVPQCAFDGRRDTFYRAAGDAKAGEALTLTLAQPAAVRALEVVAGDPGDGRTPAAAVLEASTDGTAFARVADLASGAAKADLAGRKVKALRLRVTADGGRLAVGEIVLAAQPAVPVFRYPLEVRLRDDEVPDMKAWCERSKEIIERWYPIIAETLASDGYTPPRRIDLTFKRGSKGIAGTSGRRITAFDGWFKAHPDDYGALVHEAIHVVQSYPKYDPVWLVEGIADYVRCWIYEPDMPRRPLDPDRIRYQDSYQVTGAFLAYLVEKYDKTIVTKLNAACRRSAYKPELFKESTGKDLDTLWEEFRQSLRK